MDKIQVLFDHDLQRMGNSELITNSYLYKKVHSEYQFRPSTLDYFSEYFFDYHINNSIHVLVNDELRIYIPARSRIDRMEFVDRPCSCFDYFEDEFMKMNTYKVCNTFLKKHIHENNLTGSFYANEYLLKGLFESVVEFDYEYHLLVGLDMKEEEIFTHIRKSIKSLINWGKKNLEIIILDSQNINKELFYQFKQLHYSAAGRKTRSDRSWEMQYDSVLKGEAFLTLALKDGVLVSGVYILMGSDYSFYGVAASDRVLMEQKMPINHWPLLRSIYYCKEMGVKNFHLGLFFNKDQDDEKIKEIINFKRAYANKMVPKPVIICKGI